MVFFQKFKRPKTQMIITLKWTRRVKDILRGLL